VHFFKENERTKKKETKKKKNKKEIYLYIYNNIKRKKNRLSFNSDLADSSVWLSQKKYII
jgi:hypothetical protein